MKWSKLTGPVCTLVLLGFFIGVHNGRIAVWKNEDPEPYRVIPCPVWILSQRQQQALYSGIRIDSMADIDRFLEEFFS